jgi:hypothetical protein
VLVGKYVATRRLHAAAVNKFGKEGGLAVPEDWQAEEVTDRALALTRKRLARAEVRIKGDRAELSVKEEKEEPPGPAFEYFEEPLHFRKVGGAWKLDANKMIVEAKKEAEFFAEDAIPALGVIFAGQIVVGTEALAGVEKGKLKTAKELKAFIERRWETWADEYPRWLKKHLAERKKPGPGRK